jgi:hypothetical protein
MSIKLQKNQGIPCLAVVIVMILLSSCTSQVEKQHVEFMQVAQELSNNCHVKTLEHVSATAEKIKEFLKKNPDRKKNEELQSQLAELMICLEEHRVKEYGRIYRQIIGKTYDSPSSGLKACTDFLAEFDADKGASLAVKNREIKSYVQDIQEVVNEFTAMRRFFAKNFDSLKQYHDMTTYEEVKYQHSGYPCVYSTWSRVVESERLVVAKNDVNKRAEKFEEDLKLGVKKIIQQDFDSFFADTKNLVITKVSLGKPYPHPQHIGKICEGVYAVKIPQKILRFEYSTKEIILAVKGMIAVNENRTDVEYSNISYERISN